MDDIIEYIATEQERKDNLYFTVEFPDLVGTDLYYHIMDDLCECKDQYAYRPYAADPWNCTNACVDKDDRILTIVDFMDNHEEFDRVHVRQMSNTLVFTTPRLVVDDREPPDIHNIQSMILFSSC
jgi:hypothetical protein